METALNLSLTAYSIYLVFVIFCFQEINNKIRNAQNSFRAWCEGRSKKTVQVIYEKNGQKISETKNALEMLDVNWEHAAWLEKDLIFHIYDLILRIRMAKNNNSAIGTPEQMAKKMFQESSEGACKDYYSYLYECYRYKNRGKWLVMLSFVVLLTAQINRAFLYPEAFTIFLLLIMLSIFVMLSGPGFDFMNNPLRNRWTSLGDEEKEHIKKLEKVVREI